MFGKSEGVNRMREKNIYLYILKEMTWQPTIGWRKTLVLRQLLIQCFLVKEIGFGSSLNPLYLTKTLVIYSFIIGLIVVKKFVFIALLDKQWFISK